MLIKHRENFCILPYVYMEEGYDYLFPIEIRTRYFLLRYLRFNICLKKETREKDAKFLGNGVNVISSCDIFMPRE
jgi:hypothetical protein